MIVVSDFSQSKQQAQIERPSKRDIRPFRSSSVSVRLR